MAGRGCDDTESGAEGMVAILGQRCHATSLYFDSIDKRSKVCWVRLFSASVDSPARVWLKWSRLASRPAEAWGTPGHVG